MRRLLLRTLPVLALVAALGGCATVTAALPKVIAAVTDAVMVLDAVDGFIDQHFKENPDPAAEASVRAIVARTRGALSAALRTANAAQKLDQAEVDGAFAEFRKAYQDLMAVLAPLGVVTGKTLRATAGQFQIPTPLALTLTVE